MKNKKRIYERHEYARRKAIHDYAAGLAPRFWRADTPLDDNLPRLKTLGRTDDRFATEHEAEIYAQQNADGRFWEVSYFTQLIPLEQRIVPGRREWSKTYYVRFLVRIGAPFREAAMTWEIEEAEKAMALKSLRIWRSKARPYYGTSAKWYKDKYHRRWRHAGRRICWLNLRGEDDSRVDPMPDRLGILWDLT